MVNGVVRVVGLGRVSTRKTSQGTSLARQRAELEELAQLKGWTWVGWFEDRQSGATLDRPGLTAALDALARGKADALVVHDVDRLGRDVKGLLGTVDALAAKKKGLYIRDWEVDATGAHGRMLFTTFAMFAEFYRRLHREKIVIGMARSAKNGKRPGRVRTIDYGKIEQARALREESISWSGIAERLGGTAGAWSRLLSRSAAAVALLLALAAGCGRVTPAPAAPLVAVDAGVAEQRGQDGGQAIDTKNEVLVQMDDRAELAAAADAGAVDGGGPDPLPIVQCTWAADPAVTVTVCDSDCSRAICLRTDPAAQIVGCKWGRGQYYCPLHSGPLVQPMCVDRCP